MVSPLQWKRIDAVIKPFDLDEVKDRLGAGQRPYSDVSLEIDGTPSRFGSSVTSGRARVRLRLDQREER
jgi:hypothetical protein